MRSRSSLTPASRDGSGSERRVFLLELVLDFGLNTQMTPNPNETVKLTHRVVMNFFTAKRLLGALMNIVQQHENTFGALELDFQKRARGGRPALAPKK